MVTSMMHPDLRAPIAKDDGKAQPPACRGKSVCTTSHSETGTWVKLMSQVRRSDQTLPMSVCPGCLWEKKDGEAPFLSHAMDQSTI